MSSRRPGAPALPGDIVAAAVDISARGEAAELSLYRLALEAASVGLWELDLQTGALVWSDYTRELLGVPPETRPDFELGLSRIHPADRERLLARVTNITDPKEPLDHYQTEFRLQHDDGRVVWVDARGRVDFLPETADAPRRALRVLGVLVDITPRKRVEQELRESERRIATLLSNLPGVAYRCLNDSEWTVLYVSDGCRELYGYEAHELRANRPSLGQLIHAEDRERVWQGVQQALARRGPFKLEYRILHAAGEVRWVWEQGQGVFDEASGELVAIEGFITDVTARRRAEDALRMADRQKDHFLAMLGHELRNPLAIIRAASQVLAHDVDDAMLAQTRAVLERQTAHMAHLVDGLLDVSRIVRGKLLLERQPLDLGALIASTVADHTGLMGAERPRVELRLPAESIWVRGDRVRLVQVVGNLLANALKATVGGGRIAIGLERTSLQGCCIEVSDTGVGIEPQMLEFIFEPFQQAPQSLDRTHGGLGLGLALVRGIVELHGGTIQALTGGLGHGSTFRVHLQTCAAPTADDVLDALVPAERRVWDILLVEDNPDASGVVRQMLIGAGHTVHVEHTGDDALRFARASRPEVVLCDLGLPGLSGYEVAVALRADEALRDTLLVAVTGYGHDEARRKSQEAGFDAHLTKPVDLATLEATLERLAAARMRESVS